MLLFGGLDGDGLDGETWVYDLSENTWTLKTPDDAPSARNQSAMASLGGDQALLFGGYDGGDGWDGETWVATGFFTPARVYLPLVVQND